MVVNGTCIHKSSNYSVADEGTNSTQNSSNYRNRPSKGTVFVLAFCGLLDISAVTISVRAVNK